VKNLSDVEREEMPAPNWRAAVERALLRSGRTPDQGVLDEMAVAADALLDGGVDPLVFHWMVVDGGAFFLLTKPGSTFCVRDLSGVAPALDWWRSEQT